MKLGRPGIRAALIATPLLAFTLYAAFNWFRIEDGTKWVGMGPEARGDPYLAYTRLLSKLDARATFSKRPSSLDAPAERGVLLLASRRLVYMTPDRVAKIAAWVQRGGTLVLEAEPAGIDDPLLEAVGVDRVLPEEGPRQRMRPRSAERRTTTAEFDWSGSGKRLFINFGYLAVPLREAQPHASTTAARAGNETLALAYPLREGRVVALGSFGFLRNTQIAQHNHAELGWQLAALGRDRGGALLFLRPPRAALGEWLVAEAWPVLIAAGLLLAIWLGRVVPRFGPLAPADVPVRRRLTEHIAASGRFLWSRGEAAYLLDAARERVWRAAARRFSKLATLPPALAVEKVAESAATSRAKVNRALVAPAATEPAFVAAAAALQEIESHLGRRKPAKLSRKGRS